MLNGLAVLIVEDDPHASSELAFTVEYLGGQPVGPVATIGEAIALLDGKNVAAAIVDANLRDGEVTPLALLLVERAVPFVVHTGTGLPAALAARHPDLPVVIKPTRTKVLLAELLRQVELASAIPSFRASALAAPLPKNGAKVQHQLRPSQPAIVASSACSASRV